MYVFECTIDLGREMAWTLCGNLFRAKNKKKKYRKIRENDLRIFSDITDLKIESSLCSSRMPTDFSMHFIKMWIQNELHVRLFWTSYEWPRMRARIYEKWIIFILSVSYMRYELRSKFSFEKCSKILFISIDSNRFPLILALASHYKVNS